MVDRSFSRATRHFVAELDEAAQWHMAWTRMVLRCAVLRTHPGDDVLSGDAHHCCRFERWVKSHRERLANIDAATLRRLDRNHRQMHDAARRICGRILNGVPGEPAELDEFEHSQAGVVAALSLLKNAYLAHSARIDALTGLPLRHGLEEDFERSYAQARRHGESLVVMMLDLDHFKRVNDLHGHAVGDLALRHAAALLKHHCRAGEPVIRYGGEEFVALLQAADHSAAQRAVQRILQAMRDNPLNLPDGKSLELRASAGLAEVDDGEPMTDAIARADDALYAAKAAGRDTWRWAERRASPATAA